MQYVRSISGSVSKTWNSINPATLSGAIDVIVVEQEDGSLACSPFHVRFGKFSLLRPYEKKVEFKVNNVKQDYAMKLGEGGEAFFVFETTDDIPESLQTSPLVSPAASPTLRGEESSASNEPDFLDLETNTKLKSAATSRPGLGILNTGLNAGSSTSLGLQNWIQMIMRRMLTPEWQILHRFLDPQRRQDQYLEIGPRIRQKDPTPTNYSHLPLVSEWVLMESRSESARLGH